MKQIITTGDNKNKMETEKEICKEFYLVLSRREIKAILKRADAESKNIYARKKLSSNIVLRMVESGREWEGQLQIKEGQLKTAFLSCSPIKKGNNNSQQEKINKK